MAASEGGKGPQPHGGGAGGSEDQGELGIIREALTFWESFSLQALQQKLVREAAWCGS